LSQFKYYNANLVASLLLSQLKINNMKENLTANASVSVDATPSKVWKALTNPKLIKQYMFGTEVNSDWKEGNPITWKG
jgi:uncharacterized protein YndB with AHSA1/START domain